AGGENARAGRPLGRVDARAARTRIELDAEGCGELVVRDPLAGEDDRVAGETASRATVQIDELHLLHPRAAVDRRDRGSGLERDAVAERSARTDERERLVLLEL